MVSIRASVSVVALFAVLLALSGCSTISGWFSAGFELPAEMPNDFAFHIERQGARSPGVNYLYKFTRNGSVAYWVKAPSPSARPNEGTFEISGNDVIALYDQVRGAGISGYSAAVSNIAAPADVTFYVMSQGREKRLTFAHADVPLGLANLRESVLNYVPTRYQQAEAPPDHPDGPPERFVGDSKTRIFYASDSKEVEVVPPERRVFFATAYEALDHNYYPDPVSKPMDRVSE
jgi:hypothetical protein